MRFFTHSQGVREEIFSAYMRGGRLWPQMRWANNILILYAIMNSKSYDFSLPIGWEEFSTSKFSAKQLSSVQEVMKRDHLKASIFPKKEITQDALINEWEKTKIGLYKTLLGFRNNKIENYLVEDDKYEIENEIKKVKEFDLLLNYDEYSLLKELSYHGKKIISETTNLSNLFRITYYPPAERKILLSEENNKQTMQMYQIPQSLHDPITLRAHIKCIIFKILYHNLFALSQKKCSWIIYDHDWAEIYKINFLKMEKNSHELSNFRY